MSIRRFKPGQKHKFLLEEFPKPHGAEREQKFIDFPAEMRGERRKGKMANQKTIVLSNCEVMLTRLLVASTDPDLQRHFYPLLLKHATEEMTAGDIVLMLVDALDSLDDVLGNRIYWDIGLCFFVAALTDDPVIRWETTHYFEQPSDERFGGGNIYISRKALGCP
jgi:hypothetical protein